MIKNEEIRNLVHAALRGAALEEYKVLGLRVENQVREVGEICLDCSKHNPDSDDGPMPPYGTIDYEKMQDLEGLASWGLDRFEESDFLPSDHIYLIGGDAHSFGPNEHEIVIKEPTVLAVIQ